MINVLTNILKNDRLDEYPLLHRESRFLG